MNRVGKTDRMSKLSFSCHPELLTESQNRLKVHSDKNDFCLLSRLHKVPF